MSRSKIYHVPGETLNAVEDAFHDLGTCRGGITESRANLQITYSRLLKHCRDFAVSLNQHHPVRHRTLRNINKANALMSEVYRVVREIEDDTGNCFASRYTTDPEDLLSAFSGSFKMMDEEDEKPAGKKTKK